MESPRTSQSDQPCGSPAPADAAPGGGRGYGSTIRAWERKVPWYRRVSARTGLQGKLVLCFVFLLAMALGSSCWLFVTETHDVMDRMAGQHAMEIGRTIALAGETPLERGNVAELEHIGSDLIKSRGVVAVAFFNADGTLLTVASHDAGLNRNNTDFFANPKGGGGMMHVDRGWRPSCGPYARLTTPVVSQPRTAAAGTAAGKRLHGYVTVCIAQGDNDSRLRNVQLTVVLIGAVGVLVSLPCMYWLVHRIFFPIRQLVAAADRITAGDLDAQVAIHRPDVIGDLARSFNEMVKQVRRQKDDLARANEDLALANGQLESANDQLEDANAQLGQANCQLAESNRDLEQKVRQRTAQFEAANRRLSREIAEKEDFLRTVSHDLNAPLRNIAGMAAMLLMKYRDTFDEDVVHRLERIQKNVQVETDLIAELLELSRIKTRRQRMENVDVGDVVRELGEMFAQDLETRQIRLAIDTPLPVLHGERARLRQVFQNLIDNAIKYMGDGSKEEVGGQRSDVRGEAAGGGADSGSELCSLNSQPSALKEIHVGCEVRPDEAGFYVRDTGIGIEPDDLDKVFCVFRRGKHQAVQSVAGKGVGLASVKSIVETYSGSIRVESEVGRGSTFLFTINGKHVVNGEPTDKAVADIPRAA